jgi:hypothetical protein
MDSLESIVTRLEKSLAKGNPSKRNITLRICYVNAPGKDDSELRFSNWGTLPSGDRIRIAAPRNDGFWRLRGDNGDQSCADRATDTRENR